MRTEKSCGPDASTLASSLQSRRCMRRWQKSRSPGRSRRKPLKPLRAGMPGDFRCDRCEYSCAFFATTSHTRLRVHWAPGIPHALFLGGRFSAQLGRNPRRGNANLCLTVIASAAKQSIAPQARKLDCFAALAMTIMLSPSSRTSERSERGDDEWIGVKWRPQLQENVALTFPSPANFITTLSPALSHTVLTRLPVSTISPSRRPLPSAARWLASQASALWG